MRILSIRGENLASLPSFHVDFEAPPLAGARLFAITGPTGSGKTTLLDALCLALFDRTPRLGDARKGAPRVGPEADASRRLPAHDPRSILRRGAAHARAEVVFEDRGGNVWRATWSVGRARGRADGNVKAQELSLADAVSGVPVAGKKTEILAGIEERLGLSYEEFTRSVLLAQGEFAAFLRADTDQRAALLERLTGSDLYTRLSVLAFQRDKEAGDSITLLSRDLERTLPLDEAGRAGLVARHEETVSEERRLGAARDLLALALRRRGEAEAASETASARREAAEAARRAREAAEAAAEETRAAEEAAALSEEEGRTRRDAAAPLLVRARALDARLSAAADELGTLRSRHADASEKAAAARAAASDARGRLAEANAAVEELHARLEAAADDAHLSRGWEAVSPALDELVDATDEAEALARAAAEAALAASRAAAEAGEMEPRQAAADEALARASLEREEAVRATLTEPVGAASAALAASRARRETVQALHALALRADELRSRLSEDRAEAAAADEQGARLLEEAAGTEARLERLRAEIARVDEVLPRARATADVAIYRRLLVPGTPCPLCGSPDHPWAGRSREELPTEGDPIQLAVLQNLQRREESDFLASLASLRARAESDRARADRARGRAAEAKGALDALLADWRAARTRLDDDVAPAFPTTPAATATAVAARALEETKVSEAAARAREEGARALLDAATACRQREDAARAAREALVRASRDVEDRRAESARRLEAARVAEEAARRRVARGLAFLKGRLGPHRPSLAEEAVAPFALRRELSAAVEAHRALVARIEAAREERAAREAERDRLVAAAQGADEAAAEAAALATAAARAVEALRAERAAVLEGRAADDVDAELAASEAERRSAAERARAAAGEARSALASARAREGEARREEEEAVRASVETREAAETAAREAGVPGGTAEALAAALEEATAHLEEAGSRRVGVEARLLSDDELRARRAAVAGELDRAREGATVWADLKALIGSHDGSRFRRYAHSLTLDALVAAANVHLAALSRRYVVRRVEGTDMDLLVVDRDLGDEPRGINGLSGGESFLVSLALALGLSSLATRRTRVESLFIDEGFGTLDPATLDTALAALDSLQASGTRVGVISHVQGMAERIGVQVRVSPEGGGRSRVDVLTS